MPGTPCVRYQVQSPLPDADGEGSALPSVLEVTPYLAGPAGSCSCLWHGRLRPTPPGARGFRTCSSASEPLPGPGPAPGRGVAVTWGAGALPPGHPAAAFTFWRPPCPSRPEALSTGAAPPRSNPMAGKWPHLLPLSQGAESALRQQFKHLSRPCQPRKWSEGCSLALLGYR